MNKKNENEGSNLPLQAARPPLPSSPTGKDGKADKRRSTAPVQSGCTQGSVTSDTQKASESNNWFGAGPEQNNDGPDYSALVNCWLRTVWKPKK